MSHLIDSILARSQRSAEREAAIKACRIAQSQAYSAQKAADVPQERRCKQPAICASTTFAEIQAMTSDFERVAANPRATEKRREAYALRVLALTGDLPRPHVTIEEMREIIADHRPVRTPRPATDTPATYMRECELMSERYYRRAS